jgi:hypothetical protein
MRQSIGLHIFHRLDSINPSIKSINCQFFEPEHHIEYRGNQVATRREKTNYKTYRRTVVHLTTSLLLSSKICSLIPLVIVRFEMGRSIWVYTTERCLEAYFRFQRLITI